MPSAPNAFAACFEHSVRHIAKKSHVPLRGCYVEAVLSMFVTDEDAYRMALTLTVHMAGALEQADAMRREPALTDVDTANGSIDIEHTVETSYRGLLHAQASARATSVAVPVLQ